MLLADPNYSLYDYEAGFAILYPLISWTTKAAESSSFQIRTFMLSFGRLKMITRFAM